MESTASTYDWSRFVKRISVKAPISKVYDMWTTQDGLESWFLRLAEYTMPDGTLRQGMSHTEVNDKNKWLWHGHPDETVEHGTTLEANGKDRYKFSFGKAGDVTVALRHEHGETLVELTQENIPTDENGMRYYHVGCTEGWTFYLANLKSILEGGIDLRNRNEKLQRVINS